MDTRARALTLIDEEVIELGVAEINARLATARETLAGGSPVGLALAELLGDVHSLKGTAAAVGLEAVHRIAHEMEDLIEETVRGADRWQPVLADTLLRAVDIMSLLVADFSRQRRGYPAATLDGAVQSLLEQVARVTPRQGDMVTMQRTLRLVERGARDACSRLGKEVDVLISGEGVEVPRSMADAVADPLAHLVRNSIDHGIEDPAERVADGKPAVGSVHVVAARDERHLVLEVADDGAGLDLERIRARAELLGLVRPGQPLEPHVTLALIFSPGFTTNACVSAVSGRGLGMDIVRRRVEALDGFIDVYSDRRQGTRVILRLPVAVAPVRGVRRAADFEQTGTKVPRL